MSHMGIRPDIYRPSKKTSRTYYMGASQSQHVRDSVALLLSYEGSEPISLEGHFLDMAPEIFDLPASKIWQILGMSKSTFYRAKELQELDMATIDKLSSLLKVYERGVDAFEGERPFFEWLRSNISNLNHRPIDLLETETGRSTVLEAIDRVEHGIYG